VIRGEEGRCCFVVWCVPRSCTATPPLVLSLALPRTATITLASTPRVLRLPVLLTTANRNENVERTTASIARSPLHKSAAMVVKVPKSGMEVANEELSLSSAAPIHDDLKFQHTSLDHSIDSIRLFHVLSELSPDGGLMMMMMMILV